MYDTDPLAPERANLLALASVGLGLLTLLCQSLGCCLPLIATVPLFAVGAVGLLCGLAALRQAMHTGLRGFELSVVGITLGAMNLLFSALWGVVSVVAAAVALFALG